MNTTVFALTLRQIGGRKRILLVGLAAALAPVGLALIYRLGTGDDPVDWTANTLLDSIVITVVLPLACLMVGTSAMGDEIEDGTAVYLLSKPLPRREIIFAKAAAAMLVTAAFVLPGAALAPMLSLEGAEGDGLIVGFFMACIFGICAYTMVFVLLSVATSRPLVIGLGYIFIWEGVLGDLFTGTRYLSIRQYCLGIADGVTTVPERIFHAELGGAVSLILMLAVIAAATVLATRALSVFELRGED
jgi:ABC-2 type transport system permease protein